MWISQNRKVRKNRQYLAFSVRKIGGLIIRFPSATDNFLGVRLDGDVNLWKDLVEPPKEVIERGLVPPRRFSSLAGVDPSDNPIGVCRFGSFPVLVEQEERFHYPPGKLP